MMGLERRRTQLVFAFVFCLISWSTAVMSQVGRSVAQLVSATGEVEVFSKSKRTWGPAEAGQDLYRGDAVRIGATGKAYIASADGTRIQLNKNCRFVLKEVAPAPGWVEVTLARVQSLYQLFSWQPGKIAEASIENDMGGVAIDVETPTVKAGVRGTRFVIRVEPAGEETTAARVTSTVAILDGVVEVQGLTGPRNTVTAQAGYQVVAAAGEPLKVTRLTITPTDAVQWALYVPPLITPVQVPTASQYPALTTALEAVEKKIESGELKAAKTQLSALIERYPQVSAPYRSLAVALLALNDNEAAFKVAQRATEIDPGSADAAMVLSYVYQARFELRKAMRETQRALALDPENRLTLINLARLRFGDGDVDGAWNTLEEARELAPRDAEVSNLRGFVRLAQSDTGAAMSEFEQAIELNSRLGEPHLGLGLVYMRRGRQEEALRSMAKAVLLDPQRSLFYSYWGKMLHEAKRFDQSLEVLNRARTLDPRDPTPEFYRALILRDLNRPGEAIRALNRAIALNDNRAVYRSRFLLDRDLASRNVNLVTLYNELGLTAWARNKALASIKSDYTNSDGHLFYAGALAEREASSYTFAAETLLARLLQPANLNSFNNFNNYTALFEQPGIQGTIEGFVGSHGVNGEVFGALPERDLAFNLGGFYEDNDGWRDTNFERFRSGAATAKWQPTPRDGIFAAASLTEIDQGDAILRRFEVDSPRREDDRLEGELQRLELGYHRHLKPHSDLLLYAAYLESDIDFVRRDFIRKTSKGTTIDFEQRKNLQQPYAVGQAHYTVRWTDHQLLFGSLQYRGRFRAKEKDTFILTAGGASKRVPLPERKNDLDISFESYYAGDIWQVNRYLTVEAAAYYDRMRNADPFEGTDWVVEGFNPRLGLVFEPTTRDTIRLAAFRYLLPFLSARLDPVDIAGIEVFRNTFEGSENIEFAAAWEHQWETGFTSLNFFHLDEDYESEVVDQNGRSVKRRQSGDLFGLEIEHNQLLTDRIGLSGGYRYLDVDRDVDPSLDPYNDVNRDEHLFRAALRYVRPDGISAGIAQTFRYIDNHNIRSNDTAAITDLDFVYEFPKKRGAARLDVMNLFDNQFNWVTDRFVLEGREPDREIRFTLSLNF